MIAAMFKESKRSGSAETLIGLGTHVEGKLVSESSIRIEGEYRGDIDCKGDVIIGECGVARSGIIARDLTIAGKVFGDIVAKGRLTITASGQLFGNVLAHTMLIQDGGIYNGNCRMERAVEQRTRHLQDGAEPALQQQQQPQQVKETQAKEKSRQAG
ncbi:polymer-forming cytoskeletal protein [Paenibacillus sp. BC26]|uniref:bactofilin family protein n=1 Tax=Paenibacillus sp. BC26 TaxID=1881032 RepID=UPI0021095F49|nr:polymer-forming cytoskeletal protein [Paenibacillus sp. BC26]